VRRRSRRRSWGSGPFAGLLPPTRGRCVCRVVDRPAGHDPFGSRWHRRDRSHGSSARPGPRAVIARPRPTVSVGELAVLIGFPKGDRSRIYDSTSGLRSRLRSVPASVRLFQRADPALGFSSTPLRVSALPATRTDDSLTRTERFHRPSARVRSVSCGRVEHRASPSFFGRTRHSPGTSAAQSVARGRRVWCWDLRTSGKQYR
jgi:hypothetical protein